MTDEAPKEIWVGFDERDYHPVFLTEAAAKEHGWNDADGADAPKYLRADHAHALVAEAYEVSGEECRKLMLSLSNDTPAVEHTDVDTCIILRDRIRALTPADAIAARDARDAETRRKALEEALDCVGHITQAEDRDAILALIEKGQTDDKRSD